MKTLCRADKVRINNPDYLFLSSHYAEVREYLALLDWDLRKDDFNGYFYVINTDEANRCQLDKDQTAILLAIRMIYDENQERLGLEHDAICTVRDLLEKVVTDYAILSARPNMKDVKRALTLLDNHCVIQRIEGKYSQGNCKFAILPTVLSVVSSEKLDAVEVFHPDRMASRILGMGDVLTLIEKAEQAYDEKQAAKLEEKLRKNRFTLQDYYDQLQQLRGMGDLSQLAGMMPGGLGKQLQGASIDEKQMAHTEAIILSMTPLERENPKLLNASRKKRVAAGCGLEVVDVNRLLKQFEMMQELTRQFSRGRMPAMLGGRGGGRMHGFGRKKRFK